MSPGSSDDSPFTYGSVSDQSLSKMFLIFSSQIYSFQNYNYFCVTRFLQLSRVAYKSNTKKCELLEEDRKTMNYC